MNVRRKESAVETPTPQFDLECIILSQKRLISLLLIDERTQHPRREVHDFCTLMHAVRFVKLSLAEWSGKCKNDGIIEDSFERSRGPPERGFRDADLDRSAYYGGDVDEEDASCRKS